MSNFTRNIKRANSKGTLAKAIHHYQMALSHYANEAHWAVKGDDIVWVGDDDPTLAAQVTLGMRKPKKPTGQVSAPITVREPDKKEGTIDEVEPANSASE